MCDPGTIAYFYDSCKGCDSVISAMLSLETEDEMKTTLFFGYLLLSQRQLRAIQEAMLRPRGRIEGQIQELAAVIFQNRGVTTGRDIHFSILIEEYAKQGYPGLIDDSGDRRANALMAERFALRNERPPIWERIITDEILVDRAVFTNFLMHNKSRILVGDPLPAPVPVEPVARHESVS